MRRIPLLLAAIITASSVCPASAAAPSRVRAHRAKHAHARRHASAPRPPTFRAEAANDASLTPALGKGAAGSAVLRAQVLLDRAHFSVGELDGRYGGNMQRAVRALRAARGLPPGENTDAAVWAALNADTAPAVVPYALTPEDVAGPYAPLPREVEDQAKLPALGYANPMEMLGERFHASPRLLGALNPDLPIQPGVTFQVPNVARPPLPTVALVRVSDSDGSVTAWDAKGLLLAWYPATVGSEHDPLPLGEWKVKGVSKDPKFVYNPELFWDAEPGDKKLTLPPGPNSPVGVVWIDLSKPHYGIHGTGEPGQIGHAESHGCIRLTNWDAGELANAVAPGVRAELVR